MSKVEIKNTSGGILSNFIYFRDIAVNEVILIADDTILGPEIADIEKEAPLNTFDVLLYNGDLDLLVDDVAQTTGEVAVSLFNDELELTKNIETTTILRANSLVTQPITQDTAGVVVEFERTLESVNLSVTNGIISSSVNDTFTYDITLNLDVVQGFASIIETWFEVEVAPSVYVPYPNSGKKKDFNKQSEGYVSYHGTLNLLAGSKFKLMMRATGAGAQLLADTLANGTGVTSAAITVHA